MSERTIADRVAHWVEDMTALLPAGMRLNDHEARDLRVRTAARIDEAEAAIDFDVPRHLCVGEKRDLCDGRARVLSPRRR